MPKAPTLAGIRRAVLNSIGFAARGTYKSALRALRAQECALNFEGLVRRIVDCPRKISKSRFAGTVSAGNWHLKRRHRPTLTDNQRELLRTYFQGRRCERTERRERGAITEDMLTEMLRYMKENGSSRWERWHMQLCHATACRDCEMPLIQANDFVDDGRTITFVTKKIHNPTQRSEGDGVASEERRQVSSGIYAELRHALAHAPRSDFRLAGTWDRKAMGRWVKRASAALQWPRELRFDGVHCNRHGRAASVLQRTGKVRAVQRALGHKSTACSLWYGRPNSERIAAVLLQREKKKAARRATRRFPR